MSPAADAACQHGCTVADTVNKSCEEKVCHKLYDKVYSDEQCDPAHGNTICTLKSQKQKRCEIVYNGLHYITCITRGQCARICLFH